MIARVFFLRLALTAAFVLAVQMCAPIAAHADEAQTFAARGVIVSISADRKVVNIAHEKIEGYMNAMTMTFEPRSVAQLDGLKAGDTVSFSFTDTGGGRRLLNAISRREH
jgi:Cu/Ag efflux protein CusF